MPKKTPPPTKADEDKWYETEKTRIQTTSASKRNSLAIELANKLQARAKAMPHGCGLAHALRLRASSGLFEPQVAGNARYIDQAAIAALARNLIETVAVCIYLGDETIGEEEWNARKTIMMLNDRINRVSFLRAIGALSLSRHVKLKTTGAQNCLANPVFTALSKDKQGKILNGSGRGFCTDGTKLFWSSGGEMRLRPAFINISLLTHILLLSRSSEQRPIKFTSQTATQVK